MTLKSGVLVILFAVLGLAATAQTLQLHPKEIRAGSSATLTWDTAGHPAYIVGYGKVSGKGSARVAPTSSTDYIMVVEVNKGVKYSLQHLFVSGAKGNDGFPSLNEFDVALQDRRSNYGYLEFQNFVWSTLQNKGYAVKGDYVPGRPFITFYTDFVLRPDLVSKLEKLRARRMAIAVDVYEPKEGIIIFGVRPKLEFQYRGESEWRADKANPLASAEAMKLLLLLRGEK
ncbi:MAG TPA: hypothetical protein VFO40_19610 [Chthoniobacterales bacterium]|nr:hypothetical protein [Chthoniobacterales bacterium]